MAHIGSLHIGTARGGVAFTLPRDSVGQTFGVFGIRGSGKTTTAVVP